MAFVGTLRTCGAPVPLTWVLGLAATSRANTPIQQLGAYLRTKIFAAHQKMKISARKLVATLLAATTGFLLSACNRQEELDRQQAIQDDQQRQIENERKEKEANERPIISACQNATQVWLDGWGNGDKVLDWTGYASSNRTGYVFPTTTGYKYEIGAKVSGHSTTLAVVCYTDKAKKVIDLQTRWVD